MSAKTGTDIKTTCSGCSGDVTLHIDENSMEIRKGKVRFTNWLADDGDLLTWECPACGYEDSYWPDFSSEFADWLV